MPDDRNMRERLARRLEPKAWAVVGGGPGDTLNARNRRTSSLRKADAILDELRNPTEAMVVAGATAVAPNIVDVPHSSPTRDAEEQMRDHVLTEAAQTWQAMIDAAAKQER